MVTPLLRLSQVRRYLPLRQKQVVHSEFTQLARRVLVGWGHIANEYFSMNSGKKKTEIKDVFDFYTQWPELRGRIVALKDDSALTSADQEILYWMIHVMDRVGPSDVSR